MGGIDIVPPPDDAPDVAFTGDTDQCELCGSRVAVRIVANGNRIHGWRWACCGATRENVS